MSSIFSCVYWPSVEKCIFRSSAYCLIGLKRNNFYCPYLRLTSGVCGSLLALFRHVELPTDELDLKTSLIPPLHKHKAPFLHFPRCSRPPGFIHILFPCAVTQPHNDGVLNSASGPPSCCLP